ncbi:MAG: hypothetical protein GX631_09400 [Dehalococcoidales bacterium]|nr:hypothetical protein [Dehalococcoidales bacterium]
MELHRVACSYLCFLQLISVLLGKARFPSETIHDGCLYQGKYAFGLMGAELTPGALQNISGKYIDSDTCHIDEKAFEKFEATFPPKEKTETESQSVFRILSSLVYERPFG